MALFSSDVSRLIYYYLLSEGYENSASTLTGECPHLKGFQGLAISRNTGRRYSRMIGPSLTELLEEYFCTKDLVTEQLESIEDANPVRPQDSLPTLTSHVFKWFKSQISQQPIRAETREASTLTDNVERQPVGKDAEVQVRDDDYAIGSEQQTPPPTIDLSVIYENLMENEALHHRIAQNINEVIRGKGTQTPEPLSTTASSNGDFSRDLNNAVKAIAEKTQADPIFESVILSLLGEQTDPSSPEEVVPSAKAPVPLDTDVMDMCPSPEPGHEASNPAPESSEPSGVHEMSLVPYAPCSVPLIMPSLAVMPADTLQCAVVPTLLPAYPSVQRPLRRIMPKILEPPQISILDKVCPLSIAVSETLSEFQKEFTFQPDDPQQPPITLRVLSSSTKVAEREEPELPKSKPKKVVMKCTRRRTRLTTRTLKSAKAVPLQDTEQPKQQPAPVSSMFRELLSVTTEYCKNKADEESVAVTGVASQSSIESVTSSASEDPPPAKATPNTLAAKKRRSGHVRQLDFDKSPPVRASPGPLTALTTVVSSPSAGTCQVTAIVPSGPSAAQQPAISSSPAPSANQRAAVSFCPSPGTSQGTSTGTSTAVTGAPGSSIKTWDAALRTAVSSSLDDSIFATPRGKAKRACAKPASAEKTNESTAPPPTPTPCAAVVNGSSSSTPNLATPQKPGETSNSSWGVPLTPRIMLDGNSSSSPFLFSFTKGFQFLTDTPVLNTPATPTIRNGSDGKLSDVALNTPRVELLRQEAATSSSLGTCTISPTQVVLGKSTPYFVPSGERAKRLESAGVTPERRPDDRLDQQPAQTGTVEVAREMMSEETLETILIEVCTDLQKRDTRKKTPATSKLVELFGEDSQNGGGGGGGPSSAPLSCSQDKEKSKPKKSRKRSKSPVVSSENFIEELLESTRREMAVPESATRKRVRKPSLERGNPAKKRDSMTKLKEKEKEDDPKKDRQSVMKSSPVKESSFANLEKHLQIRRPPLGRKAVSLKQSHLASSYVSPARPLVEGANTADDLEAVLERMHEEPGVLHCSSETVGAAQVETPSACQPLAPQGNQGEEPPGKVSIAVEPQGELVQADVPITSASSSSPAPPTEQNVPVEEAPFTVETPQISSTVESADLGVEDQNLKILAAAAAASAAECEQNSSAKSADWKKKRRSHGRLGSLENYLTLVNFAESSASKSSRNGQVSKETSTAHDSITDRVNAEMNAMSRRVQQRLQEKNIDLFSC